MANQPPDNLLQSFKVLAPDAKQLDDQTTDGSTHNPLKQANLSYDWYTTQGLYPPRYGVKVEPLICGEVAFKAIHKAIAAAKKSVDIIIWGFDPCMRFNPNESNMTIGELLEKKGQQGVECRVLVWENAPGKNFEPTVIGGNYTKSFEWPTMPWNQIGARTQHLNNLIARLDQENTSIARLEKKQQQGGLVGSEHYILKASKESKTILEDQIASMEAELAGYEKGSDGGGGPKQVPEDQPKARAWFKKVFTRQMPNVEVRTRDFDQFTDLQTKSKVKEALLANYQETDTNFIMREALDVFASHHQKLIIIDYELPQSPTCTGFVMGHNMHRGYWDTSKHYYYDIDANRVPGFGPWQDISTHVCGPILYDLEQNFVTAWDRVHQAIKAPQYKHQLAEQRQHIKPDDFACKSDMQMQAQFCRTQPEEQGAKSGDYDRSILAIYNKVLNNTHHYVYMENQYFRYPAFARLIKKRAVELADARAKHGIDSEPLYLFVLTNTPDSWRSSSSTYRMLDELGQQQLMPEAQRTAYYEEGVYVYTYPTFIDQDQLSAKDIERLEQIKTKEDIKKMSEDGEGWDIDGKDGKKPFELQEQDNLKVLVGTLTSDSSVVYPEGPRTQMSQEPDIHPQYRSETIRYRNIYIHSKLLIVDDLFTFVGSANINTRSFWVDSESGIGIPDTDLAYRMRSQLWQDHTGNSIDIKSDSPLINSSQAIRCDSTENYDHWNKLMDRNWKHKAKSEPLENHLTRFWDTVTPYAAAAD